MDGETSKTRNLDDGNTLDPSPAQPFRSGRVVPARIDS